MTDTEPGKELPSSPEELHASLRQAYFSIPLSLFYDIESFALDPKGKTKLVDALLDRENRVSAIVNIIDRKFSEVITQAATTDIFKKMIKLPWDRTLTHGRDAKKGNPQGPPVTSFGLGLYRALGLDQKSGTGIFTKDGARQGETALFIWYSKMYGEAIVKLLVAGKDPTDPEVLKENHLLPHLPQYFTLNEIRIILQDWSKKLREHYGETPDGLPKYLEDDKGEE